MKKRFYIVALLLVFIVSSASAQQIPPPTEPIPPFVFNVNEVRFGSQGIGVQSCMYVTLTNTTDAPQAVKRLYVVDGKNYAVPAPTPQMMPITIQAKGQLTISICFKASTVGEHNSTLVLVSTNDSVSVGVQGKGLKPEDLAKKPITDFTILKPSKKEKSWRFKLQLVGQSRITLQLFDALGVLVRSFLEKDIKPEGVFELPFDGTDKAKLPIANGTYYIRCAIDEIGRNSPQIITRILKVGK